MESQASDSSPAPAPSPTSTEAGTSMQDDVLTSQSSEIQPPSKESSTSPQLQQMISSAGQKSQLISMNPKFQQIVVAASPQNPPTSSKLQQIISAAVQQQPGTGGSQQVQRIFASTTQGVITPSQLQQMISAAPQGPSSSRLQQIVVSPTQLQQLVSSSTQLHQNISGSPQFQKVVATSSVASGQGQAVKQGQTFQGIRPANVLPTVRSPPPQQQAVIKPPSPQLQPVVKCVASTQIQTTKQSMGTQPQMIKSSPLPQIQQTLKQGNQLQQGSKVTSSPQVHLAVKPNLTPILPQTMKMTTPSQLQQALKPSTSQVQNKSSGPTVLQQAGKQPTTSQSQQVIKNTPIKTVGTGTNLAGKTVGVIAAKSQGVTATPRLQQMVSGTKKGSHKPQPPKITNLGDLIGKLTQGSRHVKRFKEDRRNIAKSVKPLNYGAFGSYAPSYDSSFANLSKEESDLINGSYTEFEPSAQIKNIINKDYDYTFTLADNLIDILSGGSSPKKIKLEKDDNSEDTYGSVDAKYLGLPKSDEDEQRTLSELGIDLSHLSNINDNFPKQEEGSPLIQQKLEHTTNLLKRLQQMQYDRLSVPPHPRLGHTILPPSDSEINIATEITGNLTNLAKQVPPGALVIDRVCGLK